MKQNEATQTLDVNAVERFEVETSVTFDLTKGQNKILTPMVFGQSSLDDQNLLPAHITKVTLETGTIRSITKESLILGQNRKVPAASIILHGMAVMEDEDGNPVIDENGEPLYDSDTPDTMCAFSVYFGQDTNVPKSARPSQPHLSLAPRIGVPRERSKKGDVTYTNLSAEGRALHRLALNILLHEHPAIQEFMKRVPTRETQEAETATSVRSVEL